MAKKLTLFVIVLFLSYHDAVDLVSHIELHGQPVIYTLFSINFWKQFSVNTGLATALLHVEMWKLLPLQTPRLQFACVKAITSQDRRPRHKCRTKFCSISERKTLLPK